VRDRKVTNVDSADGQVLQLQRSLAHWKRWLSGPAPQDEVTTALWKTAQINIIHDITKRTDSTRPAIMTTIIGIGLKDQRLREAITRNTAERTNAHPEEYHHGSNRDPSSYILRHHNHMLAHS
jgi:hypothetical protein